MFRVGQKVIRFREKSDYVTSCGRDEGWPECIRVGGVYTVRDVDFRAASFGWPIGLRFEEFRQRAWNAEAFGLGMWEPIFPGDCFRPVVERKTDISALQSLLVPGSKIRESA